MKDWTHNRKLVWAYAITREAWEYTKILPVATLILGFMYGMYCLGATFK